MPARMTRKHREAHEALLDWADWWISYISSNHHQMADWETLCRLGCRVQTPSEAKLPHIQYSNHRVIAINWWWEETAPALKFRAYNLYLQEQRKRKPVTPKQKHLLLDDVANFLTGKG